MNPSGSLLLPESDPWSTPFAKALLHHLHLFPGASVLDVAAGGGIPALYIADQVGPNGQVLAVDINPHQVARGHQLNGSRFPWLRFAVGDMRALPPTGACYDRISGNLSFMFFRPDRPAALQHLIGFLKPGGQIVLTFPSLGTFDSLWQHIASEMLLQGLKKEHQALADYVAERPSAAQARLWLEALGMEKIDVTEWPLEVPTGPGQEFLHHPLLRGGFLDDAYECFEDQSFAEEFMSGIAQDIASFTPLLAQRCALSAWKPNLR
jgi:ubiquinone/menaquinone biosynthesis C-methylase UbiE